MSRKLWRGEKGARHVGDVWSRTVAASFALLIAFGSGFATAEEVLRVPRPIPVRAGEMLAEAFKADVGDRVFFAIGSVALGSRARVALETQATWLKQHSSLRVVIEGYADDPGDNDVNQALAQARADAVRDRLIALGVAAERLRVAGFGRGNQVVVCSETGCGAQNRRVVTRIAVTPALARTGSETATDPPPALVPEALSERLSPGVRPALRRLF